MEHLGLIDGIAGPIFLILILWGGYAMQQRYKSTDPIYRYFFKGLIIKLLGTAAFCAIYLFYYSGGDTLDYHDNAKALVNLAFTDFSNFIDIMISTKEEYLYYFTDETGYINTRHYAKPDTFNVSRIMFFFELVTFKSYIAASFLVSFVGYLGLWKLFQVFNEYFRNKQFYLFLSTLCIPSVVFWNGGISKEIIVMFILGYFVYYFHNAFIKKSKVMMNVILAIIMMVAMISIRPYMFVAIFPAASIWLMFGLLSRIENKLVKFMAFPVVIVTGVVFSFLIWQFASGFLGEYSSVDSMIEKAIVSQDDLQHERYDGNSFDIGDFPPTVPGVLSKFPEATIAGLYRPFIFEANNIVMLFSGLEGLIWLVLSIITVIKFRTAYWILRHKQIMIFALVFILVFAFAVGLSTSNFGALVRFRIPLLPFFGTFLILVATYKSSDMEVD